MLLCLLEHIHTLIKQTDLRTKIQDIKIIITKEKMHSLESGLYVDQEGLGPNCESSLDL
jgi:hypothetical protein